VTIVSGKRNMALVWFGFGFGFGFGLAWFAWGCYAVVKVISPTCGGGVWRAVALDLLRPFPLLLGIGEGMRK
jgi:hypothetical protein